MLPICELKSTKNFIHIGKQNHFLRSEKMNFHIFVYIFDLWLYVSTEAMNSLICLWLRKAITPSSEYEIFSFLLKLKKKICYNQLIKTSIQYIQCYQIQRKLEK